MAFHVPFSQRPSGRQQSQPVYIGFGPSRRKRPKFNWWGFNGLFLFFLSLGVLSPVALLISMMGLRRNPRKMAVAGTMLSLVGTLIIGGVVFHAVQHHQKYKHRKMMARQQRVVAQQVERGSALLAFAAEEFEEFRDDHEGKLPCDLDGCALALKHVEPWKNEIMYEVDQDAAGLRSAGPDGKFFTPDDLKYRIEGETELQPLLPIADGEMAETSSPNQ